MKSYYIIHFFLNFNIFSRKYDEFSKVTPLKRLILPICVIMLWTQMDSNKVLILKYYTTIKMKKIFSKHNKKTLQICVYLFMKTLEFLEPAAMNI